MRIRSSSRFTSRSTAVAAVLVAACNAGRASDSMFDGAPSPSTEVFPAPTDFAVDAGIGPPPAQPDFGQTVTQAEAPPSLGGASLVLSDDESTAIVTDPDRDRVVVVDLATKDVRPIALGRGDEPGRLVTDGPDRVHVVLDRAGAVATIDPSTATVVARRAVCAAPQGIARDGSTLYVACAGGEVVSLAADPAGAAPKVLARVDRDLRDIVVTGDSLLVSRLRSAEVLRVRKADGVLLSRAARARAGTSLDGLEPFVAWRMVPSGSGAAVMVHQMARTAPIDVGAPQAYGSSGSPCGGVVGTAITSFEPESSSGSLVVVPREQVDDAVVPIDIARARNGADSWVVIAAGNGHTKALPQVHLVTSFAAPERCVLQPSNGVSTLGAGPDGQAVAVTVKKDDTVVVFTREPATLQLQPLAGLNQPATGWTTISLGGESREDTGHAIFHSNAGGNVACVSCHPGGADDGRVWTFSTGARRTQTLQGTLEGTAPYHWGGDAPAIETFATDVFVKRMGGQGLDAGQVNALGAWLTRIPAANVSPALDVDARARGKVLFESQAVGCSGCHAGAKLTNNESIDVGTGGTFQVPSLLGLALRAPYLHDGRAATLLDRFGPAGGDDHGHTAELSSAQVKDLITYLESL